MDEESLGNFVVKHVILGHGSYGIVFEGHHKVRIDEANCIGCSLCAQVCTANAILAPE